MLFTQSRVCFKPSSRLVLLSQPSDSVIQLTPRADLFTSPALFGSCTGFDSTPIVFAHIS